MTRARHMQPRPTREQLLAPVRRWTRQQKKAICEGIDAEVITAIEAMQAHEIKAAELNVWFRAHRGLDQNAPGIVPEAAEARA